jgi:ABC-type amino acid transport substrate-binding protein
MPNNRTWGDFMKRILFAMLGIAALSAHGALAQSSVDTLAKIKQAKAINVAFSPDSLPFSISEANGEPAGYTIDLCKRAIAQIGRAVGEGNLKVNWIAGSVSERLQMVAAGRADLECANTTPTQSRLATVDFSNLIFVDSGGLLVKTGAPINATSDLTGKRVAVLKGTTTETRLNEALRRRLINASVVTYRQRYRRNRDAGVGQCRCVCRRQDQARRTHGNGQGSEAVRAARGRLVVRALRACASARRFKAPSRSQQGADADLHEPGHRSDLHAMDGQDRTPEPDACGDVPAEFDTGMIRGKRD